MTVPGRIVVVESVYHQAGPNSPTSQESRYSRPLESDEQLYKRSTKVGTDWVKIDTGWIAEVGMILLTNDGAEEKEKAAEPAYIEIAFAQPQGQRTMWDAPAEPALVIFPGESLRLTPVDAQKVLMRGTAPNVRYTILVYSR